MSQIKLALTSNTITLHEWDNKPISVPKRDVAKLVDISNNTHLPELKTQIILDQRSILCAGGRDPWLYVTERINAIKIYILIMSDISHAFRSIRSFFLFAVS